MRESEFWECVNAALGPELGPSIIADLYLPEYQGTVAQTLNSVTDRQQLWDVVCREMDLPEEARWYHRRKRSKKSDR